MIRENRLGIHITPLQKSAASQSTCADTTHPMNVISTCRALKMTRLPDPNRYSHEVSPYVHHPMIVEKQNRARHTVTTMSPRFPSARDHAVLEIAAVSVTGICPAETRSPTPENKYDQSSKCTNDDGIEENLNYSIQTLSGRDFYIRCYVHKRGSSDTGLVGENASCYSLGDGCFDSDTGHTSPGRLARCRGRLFHGNALQEVFPSTW